MSFLYRFNLQAICLEIVQMHIECMTDDNRQCDHYSNEQVLASNIKHGFVVIIMLATMVENTLNAILTEKVKDTRQLSEFLHSSTEEKFSKVYELYGFNVESIRKTTHMKKYRELKKMRNHLIHFGNNLIGHCGGIFLEWKLGRFSAADFFVKSSMQLYLDEILKLMKKLAHDLELEFNEEAPIFGCDASIYPFAFIFDSHISP